MWSMAVSMLLAALVSWHLSRAAPEGQTLAREARADVAAANLLTYRRALIDYLNANPGATGTITDDLLTWPSGYARDAAWTNTVSGGELYVYSTGGGAPATVTRLYQRMSRSLLVGTAQSGVLVNPSAGTTAVTLPGAVTDGAVVIVGR